MSSYGIAFQAEVIIISVSAQIIVQRRICITKAVVKAVSSVNAQLVTVKECSNILLALVRVLFCNWR